MLAKRIKQLQPSATLALDAKAKLLQASGADVISLAIGEPDFSTPTHIAHAGIKAIEQGFTKYTPSAGIIELRQAIADKLSIENKIDYEPSQIMVGVGSKQLLYSLFQVLCQRGDEVLIPTPTWSTYVEQVKLSGAKAVTFPLTAPFKLTAQELAKHITSKTKAVLINSPNNPTGAVINRNELKKIAQLAVKHQIFVISDEIYEAILYQGSHCSIASFNQKIKELTITLNGFSKAYAMTGWRVGYAAGPSEVINAMSALASQMTSGTSTISQYAALKAVTGSQRCVTKMTQQYQQRRDYLYTVLKEIKGLDVNEPEGAFYIFPNIEQLLGKDYQASSAWAEALLEQAHLAVVPGEAFLAPGYVRLSYATSLSQLKIAVARLKKFIQ